MRRKEASICGAAVAASLLALPSPGLAQGEPALEEVVVTAQKRAQSIDDVGLTVAAVAADVLMERGVVDTSDLSKIVSGFTFAKASYGTPVYTLRGIGLYDSSLGSSPAIAVYVDEVALPFPVTHQAVGLDVERVEVLKGPQGTLFGQSSTGGAINYVTAKPTDSFGAGADISYDRFARMEASGFISGPLTETLKARLATRVVTGGAWQESVSRSNDENGDADQQMGRLLVDWTPTDRLKTSLNINGWRDKSESQQAQFRSNQLNIVGAPGSVNPFARVDPAGFASLTTPGSPNFDPSFLTRQAVVYGRLTGLGFAPGALVYPDDPSRAAQYLSGPNGDGSAVDNNPRDSEWSPDFSNRSDSDFYQVNGRIEYDLLDTLQLTSISSYQRGNIEFNTDTDGTIDAAFQTNYLGKTKTFSQELRLAGSGEALHWIAGGNYERSTVSDHFVPYLPDVAVSEALPGLRFPVLDSGVDTKIKTYAAFGNVDYEIGHFTVTGGARYTKSKQDALYCNQDPSAEQPLSQTFGNATVVPGFGFYDLQTAFGLDPAFHRVVAPGQCYALNVAVPTTDPAYLRPILDPFPAHMNEHNWSYRAGLNYKFDQGTLLYSTVSQGYKSGFFAAISPSTTDQWTPAKQEKLIAYEAGFKAPLADRRVQLNGAAFYYAYSDKQLRVRLLDQTFGLLERVVNVPKSRIWGIEGELNMRPLEGLNVSASATYLNSKVTDEFSSFNGRSIYNQAGYTGNFEGSELPYTPEFSAVADAQYTFPIAGSMDAFLGGTVTYQGKTNTTFHTDVIRADDFFIRAYTLLDARAGIAAQDGSWRVSVFGRNITNKYYETAIYNSAEATIAYSGRPAIYGVQFTVRTAQ